MNDSTEKNCAICAFSGMTVLPNGVFDPAQRTCKANPPTCIVVPHQTGLQVRSIWPTVGPKDWCHAFKRRPNIGDLLPGGPDESDTQTN